MALTTKADIISKHGSTPTDTGSDTGTAATDSGADTAIDSGDYVIVDQRRLLIRPDAGELEASYYADAPGLAREQLLAFERTWAGAPPARDFTDLQI